MARLRGLLFVLLVCAGLSAGARAQSSVVVSHPEGARSCARLSLASDEPAIVIPIEHALRATPEFARGEFTLSDTPGSADVVIFVRSGRLLPQAVLTYNLRADGPRASTLLQHQSRSDVTRPQNLANEIVNTLQQSCSASSDASASGGVEGNAREENPRRSLPLPSPLSAAERAERIRALHTVRVLVHSSQMDAGDVRAALAQDPGLRARNITAVLGAADAILEITHEDASSLVWKFALIDAASNALLGSGRVYALHGSHAAPAIALHLAQLLVPGSPSNARSLAVRAALAGLGRQPQWKAQLASEAYGGASGGDPLELAVEDDRLVAYARDTGRRVFSIRLDVIEDVDFQREWHSPLAEAWMSPFDEDTAGRVMEQQTDPRAAAAAAAIIVGWIGIGAVLSVVRTPQHFLTIAWRENGDEPHAEVVSLQLPRGEVKSLKAALAPLTAQRR